MELTLLFVIYLTWAQPLSALPVDRIRGLDLGFRVHEVLARIYIMLGQCSKTDFLLSSDR